VGADPERRGRPERVPTVDAVTRVSTADAVSVVGKPSGRVYVHGLATHAGALRLADNTNAYVYRVG